MNDFDAIFILIALFNTNLGLTNSQKNKEQYKLLQSLQKEVVNMNEKIDLLLKKDEQST